MKHVALEAEASLLIGGQWHGADTSMTVTNPWSGELLARVACATPDHARAAVASAIAGLEDMRALSTGARARILSDTASRVEAEAEAYTALIEIGRAHV